MGAPVNAYGDSATVTMLHLRNSEDFIKHEDVDNYLTVSQDDISIADIGVYEIVIKVEYND